jgi:hypothetical protein
MHTSNDPLSTHVWSLRQNRRELLTGFTGATSAVRFCQVSRANRPQAVNR